MQNFGTLLTFVAAQIGVVIAIWSLFHGTGDAGHDTSPVNYPTPPGRSTIRGQMKPFT
jgi:hypothetical protein